MARFSRSALSLVLLVAATPAARAVGRGGPELAELLPAETLFYVSADARTLQTGLRSLGLAGLLREEEMQDFLAPLYDQYGHDAVYREDPIGSLVDSLGLSDWVRGEAGIGFSGITFHLRDGTPLRVSAAQPVTARLFHELISDPSQGAPISRVGFDFLASIETGPALRAMVSGFLQDPPPNIEVGRVQMSGQSITAVNIGLDEGIRTTLYADMSGDRWLISGDQERLGMALTGGPQHSLAGAASWKSFSSRLKNQGNVLFAFADVARALGIVRNCIPPIIMEEASILGLDGLTGVGLGVAMSDGGVRESVLLAFDGDPQGVLSLFDAFGGGFPSLAEAPADTTAFMGVRFDARTLIDRVEKLLVRVAPRMSADILRELRISGPGEQDLMKDVLPALGSELTITVSPPRSGAIPNLILSIDVRDAEKFERLLATAKSMVQQEGGVQIKPLALKGGPEGFVLQIDDAPIQPAFVMRGDRLYGAVSPLTLKGYLYRHLDHEDRQTLATSDGGLPAVVDAVCGGRTDLPTLLVALDLQRAIPFLYDTFAPFLPSALDETGTGLDAMLLPMSETLQPHLSGVAIALSRGKEGISIDLFSPTGLVTVGAAAAAIDAAGGAGGPVVVFDVGDTD